MPSQTEWKKGFPSEEGYYWFYGYLFGQPQRFEYPKLEQLQVRKVSNGYAYIACNSFISPLDLLGFWQPDIPPSTDGLAEQLPKPAT